MEKLAIYFSVICMLTISCTNAASEQSEKNNKTVTNNEHRHDGNSHDIELNSGEKWKVDENMLTHIRNMEKDVLDYTTSEQKDYKLLAEKLQKNADLLTSNCTMKGKAHDELHKWLLPYLDMVNELSKAGNESEAAALFENTRTSFSTFNQYFK